MTTNKKEEMENIFDEERYEDNVFYDEEAEKRKKKMEKPAQKRIQEEENIFDVE